MLPEKFVALASAGGSALVTAMDTDGWTNIQGRAAHLFGRGEKKETEIAAERMDQSRVVLAASSGSDLERMRAEQEIIWRTRLGDLLERDPGVEQELRRIIAEIQAQTMGPSVPTVQHVIVHGQVQQAIQGQGVQNVTFGDRK